MPEMQNIEYKSNWHDDYLKTICGFVNADGGRLFLGIDDNGIVIGIPNYKKLMDTLPNKIQQHLGLLVGVNLLTKGNLFYIEVITQPQTVAISLRGRFYKRVGSVTRELTGNNLNEFLLQKAGRTWDDVIESRAVLNDIDEKEVDRFIKISQKTNRLPDVEGLKLIEILEKLHLTNRGSLKRAAIILFGKEPGKFYPNIKVKIGRFGISDDDLIYDEIEEGNLFHLLRNIIQQLNRKFFKTSVKFEGFQRIVKEEYPVEAIREMLLNALIHKQYSSSSAIQIKYYHNKISIWNEGALPSQLNSESLKINHPSLPRNPFIADIFYMSGYIDTWGRGTLKIFSSCKKAGLPEPKIIESFGGVSTTLFTHSEKSSEKSSEKIIKLIKKDPQISAEKIAEHLGISSRAVEKQISKLKERKILVRIGPDRGGFWKLINDNQ